MRVVHFPGARTAQLSKVGGKGQSLIRMTQVGLPVPPGFILTTEFFLPWIDRIKGSGAWKAFLKVHDAAMEEACKVLKQEALTLEFSREQEEELESALRSMTRKDSDNGGSDNGGSDSGNQLYAVRSSSPEEDLEGYSFAGGYETILGAREAELKEAVRRAFASCLDYRVQFYKLAHDFDITEPRIAVIVQEQIASEVSGVVFSLNPLTNCYDEAVFNANFGLGESVVSGMCTPDTIVVDKPSMRVIHRVAGGKEARVVLREGGGTENVSSDRISSDKVAGGSGEISLSDGLALSLTRYVKTLEDVFRKPVDVEWAVAGDQEYILQARPITSYVPIDRSMLTPPGAPRRLYLDVTLSVQALEKPISPMAVSLISRMASSGSRKVYGFDMTRDNIMQLLVTSGGRLYMVLSEFLALLGKERMAAFFSIVDPITARSIRELDTSRYQGLRPRQLLVPAMFLTRAPFLLPGVVQARAFPDRAHAGAQTGLKRFMKQVQVLRQSRARLEVVERKLFEALFDFLEHHSMPCFLASRWAVGRMKMAAAGASDEELRRLEMALPNNVTTEMGLDLYRLSQELDETLEIDENEDIQDQTLPPEFIEKWKGFLDKYGHRGPAELDIAVPRYRDDPSMLFEQVRVLSESASEKNNPLKRFEESRRLREETFEQICRRLENDPRRKRRFQALYHVWVTLGGYRELHKYCLIYVFDAIRQRLLVEGERLVKKKRLERVEQIFDLTIDEIEKFGSRGRKDLVAMARANRAPCDRLARVGALPAIIDSRGEILRPPPPAVAEDGTVLGAAISNGVVRGRIKVLNSPDEKPLEYGEILVARATDPGWTPLFVNAGGLILEVGGLLQHGALVAREYGLPCVGGVTGATTLWEDGTLVEVDGGTGVIRLLPDD